MRQKGLSEDHEPRRLPFPASAVLRLSTATVTTRIVLVVAATLICAVGFVLLFPLISRSAIGLTAIPIIVTGVSFGFARGVLAALLAIPASFLLFYLGGDASPLALLGTNFWMAHGVFLIVGAVAGMMSDLWRRLHRELNTRQLAESKLEFMARHDQLTGAFNRYALDEILSREMARAERYQHPIGFLMIDINRFKEVNDRFGHQMGDRVLQTVAEILLQQTRASDFVFRYGGDEFLVVLPETNGETEHVLQRIRAEVAQRNEANPLLDFPVTLAIGEIHRDEETSLSLDEILAELDRRMYEDKRSV